MREIRQSGSEGGGTGYSTGPPYPYYAHAPAGLTLRHPLKWLAHLHTGAGSHLLDVKYMVALPGADCTSSFV